MTFLHPPEMAKACLAPLSPWPPRESVLSLERSRVLQPLRLTSLAEQAGGGWLPPCKRHSTAESNLLLLGAVTARRAGGMFSPHHASAAGGTDASCLSLANAGIVFLSGQASAEIPAHGRRKRQNVARSLLPKSSPGANGNGRRDSDKMTRGAPICHLILVFRSRGEEGELALDTEAPLLLGSRRAARPDFLPELLMSSEAGKRRAVRRRKLLPFKSLELAGLFSATIRVPRAPK